MAIPEDYLATCSPRPYAEVRDMVRDGDILMCAAHDMGSRLIRWATRSVWSHCALAFWLEEVERVIVLECVEHMGVRAVPLSDFVRRTSGGIEPYPGRIVLTRHREIAALEKGVLKRGMSEFAFDRLGSRFSNKEMLKIALRMVLGRLDRATPTRLRPDDEVHLLGVHRRLLRPGRRASAVERAGLHRAGRHRPRSRAGAAGRGGHARGAPRRLMDINVFRCVTPPDPISYNESKPIRSFISHAPIHAGLYTRS